MLPEYFSPKSAAERYKKGRPFYHRISVERFLAKIPNFIAYFKRKI